MVSFPFWDSSDTYIRVLDIVLQVLSYDGGSSPAENRHNCKVCLVFLTTVCCFLNSEPIWSGLLVVAHRIAIQ